MVTDEELTKMIRKAYNENLKNPPFSEVPTDKLQDVVETLKEKKKDYKYDLSKITHQYWELKRKIREADRTQQKARSIIGERKGRTCPAKKHIQEEYRSNWTCEIRTDGYYNKFYDEETMYRRKCSTCKTKDHLIKKRLTWKRVFVPAKKEVKP